MFFSFFFHSAHVGDINKNDLKEAVKSNHCSVQLKGGNQILDESASLGLSIQMYVMNTFFLSTFWRGNSLTFFGGKRGVVV